MDKLIAWATEHNTLMVPARLMKQFEVAKELRRWQNLNGVEKTRKLYRPSHEVMILPTREVSTDASGKSQF